MSTRPGQILSRLNKQYPNAFKQLAAVRASTAHSIEISTMKECLEITTPKSTRNPFELLTQDASFVSDAVALNALAAWRLTKGIYVFDHDWYLEVYNADISQNLPWDMLTRLPEWCVYICTPNWNTEFGARHGFFAWLGYNPIEREAEMYFLMDHTDETLGFLSLPKANSIDEGVAKVSATSVTAAQEKQLPELIGLPEVTKDIGNTITTMTALVLYLCIQSPDIHNTSGLTPHKPQPKTIKGESRFFAANTDTIFEVGYHMGRHLRQAIQAHNAESQGHNSPRPHVRRAHFHTYRTGMGRKETVLRFLSPILVNVHQAEIESTTIHHVKKQQ